MNKYNGGDFSDWRCAKIEPTYFPPVEFGEIRPLTVKELKQVQKIKSIFGVPVKHQ